MKKIYFSLLGAMIALTVNAQQSELYHGEWRLDSVITVLPNGSFDSRQDYRYNAAGQCVTIFDQEMDGETLNIFKTDMTYNEQGMTKTQDMFQLIGGDAWGLIAKSEVTEYSPENGMPMVVESSRIDETNPAAGVVLASKSVITKYHGYNFAEEEVYVWLGGEWQKNIMNTAEFNEKDQMVRMVAEMSYMGFSLTTETTYEYESHGNVSKETTLSYLGDASVATYEYEYDANDNIAKVTTKTGFETTISYYYWSRGEGANVQGIKSVGTDSPWYDLGGRRLNGKPIQKGIFIHNGKKVYNK